MTQYKPIPVETAVQIARHFDKSMVLIVTLDPVHAKVHTVTYGVEPEDKEIIAAIGDRVGRLVSGSTERTSYEDFRFVDQAKRAKEIRELRDFVREVLDTYIYEGDPLWDRAQELITISV